MFTCILIVLWKRLSFRMKKKKQAFFIANLYKPSNYHIKKKKKKHSWLIRSQTRNRIRKNWLESNRLGKSITNVFLCVCFWVLHLYRKNWIPEAYSLASRRTWKRWKQVNTKNVYKQKIAMLRNSMYQTSWAYLAKWNNISVAASSHHKRLNHPLSNVFRFFRYFFP